MQYNINICLSDEFTNTPGTLLKYGATLEQANTFINEKLVPIREMMGSASEQIESLKQDDNLSENGKQNEIAKVISKTIESITNFADARVKQYETFRTDQQKKLVLEDPQPKNELIDYLQQQEIRSFLSQLEEEEIELLYLGAIEQGKNPLLIKAVENDPLNTIHPRLPDHVIQKGRNRRIEMQHPETIREIELVERMVIILTSVANIARKALSQKSL